MRNLHDLHLSRTDAERIAALLMTQRREGSLESDASAALAEVLAHARRVPPEALGADRVALGSTVTYREEPSGARRTVTLADPADERRSPGSITVLSPIGRALIGRRRGDVVDAVLPGPRLLEIHIAEVRAPGEALLEAA